MMKCNLQGGTQAASDWDDSFLSAESHVIQMYECCFEVARTVGKSYFLVDRYFLSGPALERWKKLNADDEIVLVEIITKAKSNCVAYQKPEPRDPHRRGRPRKKGAAVRLKDYWDMSDLFQSAQANMYGKTTDVEYYSCDLLWGKNIYQELRFVLVKFNGNRCILVSTDLTLSPVEIIELYALRFKIESNFREFKQQFGGFTYHFWTKTMKKLSHFRKKDEPDPLASVTSAHDRKLVLKKIRAIEAFVFCNSVAMGMVQMISLAKCNCVELMYCRYLRTRSDRRISEGTVMHYLRNYFFACMARHPHSFVTQYIREKQVSSSNAKMAA